MKKILILVSVMSIFAFASCSQKKVKEDEITNTTSVLSSDIGNSDEGKAMGLQTIHFDYDSFLLEKGAKDQVKGNAQILKDHPSVKIQIEGHCDNRGGIQYNLALGEKLAKAVKHALVDAGVAAARISTVSFGKEKPLDTAETEEAYAKNRRANFVITEK